MRRALSLVALWTVSLVGFVFPQQPVTRADAVAAALARGARAAFGRADTAAAAAVLHGARLYPNPALAATYTKDVPHYHVIADLPLDLPWLRSARIGAAASARDAARYGFAFERARPLAHRSAVPAPRRQVGVENGDPTQGGPLPTIGLSLPLPLFNWNGGEVARATAARDRAQANLEFLQRETAAALARAQRAFAVAMARVQRDRRLLASADRVAAMSLQAYAEGAVALPNVLEAQRNAREALGRYVDDVAAASNAAAAVRLLTASDQP